MSGNDILVSNVVHGNHMLYSFPFHCFPLYL